MADELGIPVQPELAEGVGEAAGSWVCVPSLETQQERDHLCSVLLVAMCMAAKERRAVRGGVREGQAGTEMGKRSTEVAMASRLPVRCCTSR